MSWNWSLLVTLLLWVTAACSNVRLLGPEGPAPANAQSKGEFCISEPQEVKRLTKILFIVDKSYSNTEVFIEGEGSLPGTDPGAIKRSSAIENFVQKNLAKDYQYGLVAFQINFGESYIVDPVTGDSGKIRHPR